MNRQKSTPVYQSSLLIIPTRNQTGPSDISFRSSLFLILAACGFYGSVWSSHCPQRQLIPTFLDSAADFIARAKDTISACDAWDEFGYLDNIPVDCADHYNSGSRTSGIYVIKPNVSGLNGEAFKVFCDMDTDGGGWTVIQRRGDYGNAINAFFKDWKSYRDGFGLLDKEFWLGNEYIHAITSQRIYSARFDLEAVNEERKFAVYDTFSMDGENNKYALHASGYKGDAGDSLSYHNGMKFSTKDRDHDENQEISCAITYKGAWWYKSCLESNLNGINYQGAHEKDDEGIDWIGFRGHRESLTKTEIKVRPKNFKNSKK